jgi:hypothetical protein
MECNVSLMKYLGSPFENKGVGFELSSSKTLPCYRARYAWPQGHIITSMDPKHFLPYGPFFY